MGHYIIRSLSLAGSFIGALCNLAFALRLLTFSRSLILEGESEWEGSGDVWAVDSVRVVWALLFAYFAAASTACFIGFVGIAKHIQLFVRIYRDYSIADFVFVTLTTLSVSYTTFSTPYVRSAVCEELSRHPELMRDMGEMGLSLENCEHWFERAVVALLGIMFILIVIRLHIVIALSQYYSHVSRELLARARALGLRAIKTEVPMQRIYLVPTPSTPSFDGRSHHESSSSQGPGQQPDVTVYATVPIGGMSEAEARRIATEAWVGPRPHHGHRHSHSHSTHSHTHRHHPSRRASTEKSTAQQ